MARRVAITGATGFLGRHLVRVFDRAGWRVRVLARRDPVAAFGAVEVEVTPGGLEDPVTLGALCDGADLVIHAAGLVKARRDVDFHRVNVEGAGRLAQAAAERAPTARVLLVSSLAAREPGLSAYAASKRAAETAMAARLGDRLTVARPTAIYGPGDRDILPLFVAAARGRPLPVLHPEARITLVHVEDAAQALLALADSPPLAGPIAVCDDRPQGYGWDELTDAVARAVGREARTVRLPDMAIQAAARLSGLSRLWGRSPVLTSGKAREILHPDWSVRPGERGAAVSPILFPIERGFADTVAWARATGRL